MLSVKPLFETPRLGVSAVKKSFMDMDITRNDAHHRFETTVDGQLSVAQYEQSGDQMTITHVIVAPALRGQNIGSSLAGFIVQTARAEKLKIVPQCPFMAAYFERHPDAADVLA